MRTQAALPARWPWLCLAGALALAAALLLYETRGLIFYYDEWTFLLVRRENDADAFLAPHNEHPVLVPVLVWKALWTVLGTAHYLPYRLLIVALHLLICVLLFPVARAASGRRWRSCRPCSWRSSARRSRICCGRSSSPSSCPWPAGSAIVLALDARRDGLAAGLLDRRAVLLGPRRPGRGRHRGRRPAGPGAAPRGARARRARAPLHAWSAPTACAAPSGARTPPPRSSSSTRRRPASRRWRGCRGSGAARWRSASRPCRLAARAPARPAAGLLAALARCSRSGACRGCSAAAPPPPPSHYLYPGVVFVALVLFESSTRPAAAAPRAAAVVVALTAVAVVPTSALHDGAKVFRTSSELVSAELGALELARDRAADGLQARPGARTADLGRVVLRRDRRTGSIADAPASRGALRARPPGGGRDAAARAARRADPVAPAPGTARPAGRGELAVPRAGLVLHGSEAPAAVALRRFVPAGYARPDRPPGRVAFAARPEDARLPFPEAPALRVAPGAPARIAPPGGGWRARLRSTGPLSVCSA